MKALLVRLLASALRWLDVFYEVHRYDAARSGEHFSMGRFSYAPPRVLRYGPADGRLLIGSFCSIAWDATFMLGGHHDLDRVTTFPLRAKLPGLNATPRENDKGRGDIVVGNDVWIGAQALVLAGVTIGNGAVIGAGAVVAGDVRPYAVVVGNPAREIRRRFTDSQIEALEAIAWWDWPISQIRAHWEALSVDTIEAFIARFGRAAA